MTLPSQVTLVEVGPRDGLQNEKQTVSAADKIELVHRLQAAGLREIEVTSFVSPKWVPQMADNAEVMAGLERRDRVRYSVLVPNMKGLEAALQTSAIDVAPDAGRQSLQAVHAGLGAGPRSPQKPDEIVVFGAASEAFSQRNINCSIEESIERFRPVVAAAKAHGLKVRCAISCALGCPYQGEVSLDDVERVVMLMKNIGVDHCGVADTIGIGTPRRVQAVMERALKHYPLREVSGHFHDTYGQALANIYACLELGLHTFDASVAGLGGCPYAKGATGNVASEDVVFLLNGLEIDTGIDLSALADAGDFISGVLGRPSASRAGRALFARRMA